MQSQHCGPKSYPQNSFRKRIDSWKQRPRSKVISAAEVVLASRVHQHKTDEGLLQLLLKAAWCKWLYLDDSLLLETEQTHLTSNFVIESAAWSKQQQ